MRMQNVCWLSLIFSFTVVFLCLAPRDAMAATIKLRGESVVMIEDDLANKKSKTIYKLKDRTTGRERLLRFSPGKEPAALMTGQTISVAGALDTSGAVQVEQLSIETAALNPTNVRKPAVIIVNFSDAQAAMTRSQVTSVMYGSTNSVADLYKKNSLGQLVFDSDANQDGQPDIFGPYTINHSISEGCIYGVAGSDALAMATAEGLNTSLYNHFTFVLPSSMSCGWAGLAYLGGTHAYVKHSEPMVTAHELGHNLGMHHAATDWSNDGTTDSEYGDGSCIMGNSAGLKFINGPKAYQLKYYSSFLNGVVDGRNGDTIQIAPLEDDPQTTSIQTRIVRLYKANSTEMYFLSFRRPQSYVTQIGYSSGVSVHRANSTGSGKSHFLRNLQPGQTFTDPTTGLAVQAIDIGGGGAYATIKISTDCISAQPSIALDPAVVPSTGTNSIGVRITNNDSPACVQTQFDLAAVLPSGATGTFSNPSLKIAAGSTATTTLSIMTSGFVGPAPLYVSASDNDAVAPDHAPVEASAQLTVDATAPTAPVLSGSNRKATVSLKWTVSTDAGSGIMLYEVYKKEAANGVESKIGTTTQTSYSYYGYAGDSFTVVAVDYAGNRAVSNAYLVAQKGGGRR